MATNTTVGEQKTLEVKPFPKWMLNESGSLVHFKERGMGYCICNLKSLCSASFYSTTWCMDTFTDCNELITSMNI